ncbi:MAG: DUF1801 domain-containing protein [Ruminiclostridium sp.]|nr:DUF1801 domain-containing protein [Ruminiclostridium sp.]
MWVCPKCGREFKRTNQGHYCGKAPETVEEYIELQSPEARAHIVELRSILRRCAPEAAERIAWSMPMYQQDKRSISFVACKKHVSLYVDPAVLEAVRPQWREFTIKKNAIYLPYNKALPMKEIEEVVKQSFDEKQK